MPNNYSNKNKYNNDNDDDNYWNQYKPSPKRIVNNININKYNDDNDNEIEEDDDINYNNDSLDKADDDDDYEYEYKQDHKQSMQSNNKKVLRPMQENYYPSPNEMRANNNINNVNNVNKNYNDGYKRAISPVQIRQQTPPSISINTKSAPNRSVQPPALPSQQQYQQQQQQQYQKQQQQQQLQQQQQQHQKFGQNKKTNYDKEDDEWSDADDEIPVYVSPRYDQYHYLILTTYHYQ